MWGKDKKQADGTADARSGSAVVRSARSVNRTALIKRATAPRQATFSSATHEVAGPLSFTRGGMYCWYVLGGQPWDFRSTDDRMGLWDQATFRWASLKGRSIKLRSTPRPYPSYEFARS
ncbi:MAG TPA: hypothetical protein VF635_06225, partial [Propionibacteriaceae bacterium]